MSPHLPPAAGLWTQGVQGGAEHVSWGLETGISILGALCILGKHAHPAYGGKLLRGAATGNSTAWREVCQRFPCSPLVKGRDVVNFIHKRESITFSPNSSGNYSHIQPQNLAVLQRQSVICMPLPGCKSLMVTAYYTFAIFRDPMRVTPEVRFV